jgi:hypothetical protein
MGTSIDDFLKGEGIFAEAQAQAVKEVVAWQLATAMKKKKMSKNRMRPAAENEPHAGGPHPRCQERHHALQPAAGGGDCGATSRDRAGLGETACKE